MQLALFFGRFVSSINPWIGKLALWLGGDKDTVIDDSFRIFNLDCLVSLERLKEVTGGDLS